MVCIYCSGDTRVINSRPKKRTRQTWRRRECKDCESIFTTVESIELSGSVLVVYGNNDTEPFVREKLYISVYDSLKHRKDAQTSAVALTDTIISKVLPLITNAQVTSSDVAVTTYKILKNFDKPASVFYKSYHLE